MAAREMIQNFHHMNTKPFKGRYLPEKNIFVQLLIQGVSGESPRFTSIAIFNPHYC